ncbi:MAG TPA: DUF11 domain-containing protein [Acidimicrobiales bacterium]|nr:DUF11 domain-containing protein [Acidimicrobiales bacterium]
MKSPSVGMRVFAVAGAAAALVMASLVVRPADAQVAFASAAFSGYSTGTAEHVSALETANTRLADAEVAFSGASVDSKGLRTAINNEMNRVVQPAQSTKQSYGRGAGLEVGVSQPSNSETAQLQLEGRSEAAAAPSTDLVKKELALPVSLDPIAYASLLRSEAQARYLPDNCITGQDMAYGLGYAADAQLLDTDLNTTTAPLESPLVSSDANNPGRVANQSVSRLKLTAQSTKPEVGKPLNIVGSNWGLLAETRQTIAPVTLFKGTSNEVTVEVLGEWVLQAVAGGLPNTAFMHYGPASGSPDTPVLRVLRGGVETRLITLQEIAGTNGLTVGVPGIVTVRVGEAPRAIGAPGSPATVAADGTSASGAVDVVRIEVLEQRNALGQVTSEAAEVRLGHMESKAIVPAGGIACASLAITKDANPRLVVPGEEFTYTITVTNTSTCKLTGVLVEDTMTVPSAIKYSIVSTTPDDKKPRASDSKLLFEMGDFDPGTTKSITVKIKVLDDSAAGLFTNTAVATASCAVGSAQGSAQVSVPVRAEVTINLPSVGNQLPQSAAELPATGGDDGLLLGGVLAMVGAAVVRRVRRIVRRTD